ncbi:alpha,alpha-trehalose-phosphate synthase (UDP-forming) [Streptomyces sp. L500]|uniref:alpha,alpha-trehalose-phosphate synthase (UDP-forming) n=1 Tax=Streptomyces abikoensis TaxID=97398 RepID=UPI0036C4673F
MVAEHPQPAPVTAAPAAAAPIVVASNRGPVSYALREDGSLAAGRGGGGLVSGLSEIGRDPRGAAAVWVCAALGEGDRLAASRAGRRLDPADTGGLRVRMLDIPAGTFSAAYNGVANSVLWFAHHMLWQTPLEPVFDKGFRSQWAAYEAYNTAFADAIAEEAAEGAVVLVQDYHLTLVPALLRARRPDLRVGHFSHTPWAPPDYYRLLPDDVAEQVLRGVLGGDRAAFLTRRWAEAFAACCADVLGAEVVREEHGGAAAVRFAGRTTLLGVHALGADADFLRERAHRPDVEERLTALREQIGPGRRTILRVDRTELSKNIVRGLHAYRRLLEDHPHWRGRVTHLAFAYPSRQDLAVYRDYTAEVQRVADAVNAEFGTADWQPVILHVKDDFARSLAAYRMADVALVNPIRDGMNLVAKEVPAVSDHGCVLVLSREAGAAAELAGEAIVVNPYDVEATARALHVALLMDPAERAERAERLATAATRLPPARWFTEQLHALEGDAP